MQHIAIAAALCVTAFSQPDLAQVVPTILQIDLQNHVLYFEDTTASDLTRRATDPNVTTPVGARNFIRATGVADIVAINGQKVTGTFATGVFGPAFFRPAPNPGQAVADINRNAIGMMTFEILKTDGTAIGTIVAHGLAGGAAPPGAPAAATGNNYVITGGTGAFLGARGQMSVAPAFPGVPIQRNASFNEDPANRRRNGGGTWRWIAHLIPMSTPQIVTGSGGPHVFHSDFTPVTAANPARAGEVLIAQAMSLGPTVPGVDPGQAFPLTGALAQVNSPVDVTVNGSPAEVINAVGWPGTVGSYRVDFRMPGGSTAGMASVQLSAAWINGTALQIAVQ
jgi:hypothetical protein